MKKINSIWYGGKVLVLGILGAIIIPVVLHTVPFIKDMGYIDMISKIVCIIGIVLLFLFTLMLIIELMQDKYLNQHFERQRNKKIALNNGRYECPSCGNRKVRAEDKICSVCGVKYRGEEEARRKREWK